MSRRTSVYTSGFQHVNPVPNASRIGNLMMSGLIAGMDPDARSIPNDLDGQLRDMFAHVEEIVRAAGGSPDDIIKMTVWLRDPGDRSALNERWLEMFPERDALPARQVLPLQGFDDFLVICDITAVLDQARDGGGTSTP